MAAQKTITINGRTYDAHTGLLVSTPAPSSHVAPSAPRRTQPIHEVSPVKKAAHVSDTIAVTQKKATPAVSTPRRTPASSVHAGAQRSATLNRRVIKKPTTSPKVVVGRPQAGRHMDIAKSGTVTRFAPHPAVPATPKPQVNRAAATPDLPAQSHPTVDRALSRYNARKQASTKKPATAKQVKEVAIAKALATSKPIQPEPKRPWYRRLRVLLAIVFILIAIIAGLYAIYRFIPSISVSIAAAQAGVNATYPEYTPDGYSLSQPVTYSDGQIGLRFTSNSNSSEYYTITQKTSSWDSTAVLDAVVKPKSGENYATTKERGLTIYTHNSDAYWVNGGILYTIEGNAPLSGEHLRRIATSL